MAGKKHTMRNEISQRIKQYLKWAGFELRNNTVEYRKRLVSEVICCMTYSIISIALIIANEADAIVMWLNLICLLQIVIHNTVYVSKTNKLLKIDRRYGLFNYYHIKLTVVITGFFFLGIATFLNVVPPSENDGKWIKYVAIFAILTVLFNNCEELAVYAYDATIAEE